jgi:hypothetical protein
LSNKLQNYLSVFCKRVKMESSKPTRVVLLAQEKKAIRNYYEGQTKKCYNNGKKLQICAKAAPVLLTKNWCSFL